jgi:hypothetical protein
MPPRRKINRFNINFGAGPIGANQNQMPPHNAVVRIWWDSQIDAYRISTPYNAGFVEFIKLKVPVSDRQWNPDTLIWTVAEGWLAAIKELCTKTFGNVQVLTRAQVEKASAPPPPAELKLLPIDHSLVAFMKLLPYEAAQSAYRKAALALHPDRGGDMSKMADLNSIWSSLEETFYKVKK